MRILLSCLQSDVRHPVPAYKYWETYFVGGLTEGGHTPEMVSGVDWAEALMYHNDPAAAAVWRDKTWSRVIAGVRSSESGSRPDLFLSYLYPWMVDDGAIRTLQGLGVPCVNFFCDNVREFVRPPEAYRVFDLNWVPELAATRFYARAGMSFIHAAMPTWVPQEQRTSSAKDTYGVTFIGSRDAQRERLFADAIALGAPIELRGAGWPLGGMASDTIQAFSAPNRTPGTLIVNQARFIQRYGVAGFLRKIAERRRPSVSDDAFAGHVRQPPNAREYVEITQGSRIVLGVNRYPSYRHPFGRPNTYSRGRDIEAPMMGACYLTEWTEELESMYELGKEVETYRDAAEMVQKIDMLARDPERRRAMRRAAQRRALADHSVPRTLERIADRLGISEIQRTA